MSTKASLQKSDDGKRFSAFKLIGKAPWGVGREI